MINDYDSSTEKNGNNSNDDADDAIIETDGAFFRSWDDEYTRRRVPLGDGNYKCT